MKRALTAVVACLGMSSATAHATTVFLEGVTPVGSEFRFNYGGSLSPTEGVKSGSTLVVYDFAGYVSGSVGAISPNISATTAFTNPGLILDPAFTDDPNIVNLVFTYTGPDFQTTPAPAGSPYPAIDFTGLFARSTFGGVKFDGFSTLTVKNTLFEAGTNVFSTGSVGIPSPVPEPSTWGMLIGGIGMAGAAMRRRRHTSSRLAY